jgi:hypothetical protein
MQQTYRLMAKIALPFFDVRAFPGAAVTYGVAMVSALLFANLITQSAQRALIFTVAAPVSTAVFALLHVIARRFSFPAFPGVSTAIGAALLGTALLIAAGRPDRYSAILIIYLAVYFTAIVVTPATLAAWFAARFPPSPSVRRKAFAAACGLLLTASAPGVWTAFSEAPFRALLQHDRLAAGRILWRAVTSNPGGEVGEGENHVRRSVRAQALASLLAKQSAKSSAK